METAGGNWRRGSTASHLMAAVENTLPHVLERRANECKHSRVCPIGLGPTFPSHRMPREWLDGRSRGATRPWPRGPPSCRRCDATRRSGREANPWSEEIDQRAVVPQRAVAATAEFFPSRCTTLAQVGDDRSGVVELVATGDQKRPREELRQVRDVRFLATCQAGLGDSRAVGAVAHHAGYGFCQIARECLPVVPCRRHLRPHRAVRPRSPRPRWRRIPGLTKSRPAGAR